MKYATITTKIAVQDQDQDLLLLVGDTIRARFHGSAIRVISIETDYDADYYTIQPDDVGKTVIHAWGKPWSVSDFLGRIQRIDVGKRIYRIGNLYESGHDGSILQIENDEQFRRRTNA